ncbi:hypothetical protein ACA910_013194 [Epithemia clementina (nom. ined.)]
MDQDMRIRKQQDGEDEQKALFRDVWEAEAFLAEREAERLLFEDIFKASSFPPTPRPSPSPMRPPSSNCLNGRTREEFLVDQLSKITPTTQLLNSSTPQGKAFIFMNNDPLNPTVCTYPTIEQRYGLATLFYATPGNNWKNNQGWLSNQVECKWRGVFCNNGVLASNLTIRSNNMVGTLPDELSTLYGMTQMLLSNNSLTSTIPLGISNQTRLAVLDLEMNQISGSPIPPQILILGKSLKQLFLSNNLFAQERIPPDIELLTELTDLWMANNRLVGPIPTTIGVLTRLRSLILYQNQLTGPVPSQMGNLVSMDNLQLYSNVFVNSLPEEFYNMARLRVLRLQENFLTGEISSSLGNLDRLTDIRFDNNVFTGSLPNSLGQLVNLRVASFASTRLSGRIPDVFANFNSLRILDLSSSGFAGHIPSSIFSVTTLEFLYLNDNQLTGTIPPSYANPPKLQNLYLDTNQLGGTVPNVAAGQFKTLSEFTLGNNSLNGSMPTSVCTLRTAASLQTLIADCGGPSPEIQCAFPACCTSCLQDSS